MTIHLPIVTVINSRGTRDLILIMLEKNWSHNLPKKKRERRISLLVSVYTPKHAKERRYFARGGYIVALK